MKTPASKQIAVVCKCNTLTEVDGPDMPLACRECNELFPDGFVLHEDIGERIMFHLDKEVFI